MDERRQLMLVDEASGESIKSQMVVSSSWELCEISFEPDPPSSSSAARHFLLYYLPFDDAPCVTGPASSCTSQYKEHAGFHFGRARFRQRARTLLEQPRWRDSTPRRRRCCHACLHAKGRLLPNGGGGDVGRGGRGRFGRRGGRPAAHAVWPEPREVPIRMLDRLPLRWIARGVATSAPPAPAPATLFGLSFRGEAMRGEFFVFQLGVHAPLGAVRILPSWTAFAPADSARPPVLGAQRSHAARPLAHPLHQHSQRHGTGDERRRLAKGGVQPLWFGVDVPEDAVPGEYTGVVRVAELRAYPLGGAHRAARGLGGERGCDDRRVTGRGGAARRQRLVAPRAAAVATRTWAAAP